MITTMTTPAATMTTAAMAKRSIVPYLNLYYFSSASHSPIKKSKNTSPIPFSPAFLFFLSSSFQVHGN
jgi:hypothetical protein